MNTSDTPPPGDGTHERFTPTRWTLIDQAGDHATPQAQEALDQLCRIYWRPVYAFIRRQGNRAEDAEDLTQGFFVHLLKGHLLQRADRKKGKFRTFLLACLKNFMVDQHRSLGGQVVIPIDATGIESMLDQLAGQEGTPDAWYDRLWAVSVALQAENILREEYASRDMLDLFEAIKDSSRDQLSPDSYPELRKKLGLSREAFDTNLSRFRSRFRQHFKELMRSLIADTVEPADVEAEMRHLQTAWVASVASDTGAPPA